MSVRDDRLFYLEASKLVGPVRSLCRIDLRCPDDHLLGVLDGVVIDPNERKLRYFVVESRGWRRRRYLLPADALARVDADLGQIRVEVEPEALSGCEEFDARSVRNFSDRELAAATPFRRSA